MKIEKPFLVAFGVGLAVIAAAVAGILYMQRGAHIELQGAILKVRTLAMDENSSVAVIDFRFANPADYPFVVRTVTVIMEDQAGRVLEGATVSEPDAKRLFEYYPLLGPKYNRSLVLRDRIPPHHSEDRMIAARFEVPVTLLDARKHLTVRIEEVDGAVSELVEKR